jgi:hypothetical protein
MSGGIRSSSRESKAPKKDYTDVTQPQGLQGLVKRQQLESQDESENVNGRSQNGNGRNRKQTQRLLNQPPTKQQGSRPCKGCGETSGCMINECLRLSKYLKEGIIYKKNTNHNHNHNQ